MIDFSLIEIFGKLILLKFNNIVELSSYFVISNMSPAPKLNIPLIFPISLLFKSKTLHSSKSE
mgnify:CR=1 FL=1